MSTAWIDPVGGLAGDMLVAALLDAGAPEDKVLESVRALGLEGWTARTERVWRGPFHATRFVVTLDAPDDRGHSHEHGHGHDHSHEREEWRRHSRKWVDIRAMLLAAPLSPRVQARAVAAFSLLAEAEGRVHGLAPEAVTFHEVGAIDSIVDVVAVCAALECLGVDRLVVGTIPLGTGHTVGEHGWIPLPAPATVECLRGLLVEGRDVRGETVTPTGAALVGALATSGPIPAMRILATGVGAGTWDPASHPNVVRVLIGAGEAGAVSEVAELRAEIDSLHPEAMPPLLQALLDAGAIEATITPVLMKKGRPGFLVTTLALPAHRVPVGEALLRHGRTLGYRWQTLAREVLARRLVPVRTAWGEVNVKIGERDGVVLHAAPEFEECARLAAHHGVPVSDVIGEALAAWSTARG